MNERLFSDKLLDDKLKNIRHGIRFKEVSYNTKKELLMLLNKCIKVLDDE